MPFGSRDASLLRQSRFWAAQLAGWLLVQPLYFREAIDGAFSVGQGTLIVIVMAASCSMAIACSSALAAVYLRMPRRWLTGVRGIPIAVGLSLLGALPWATVLALLFASAKYSPYGWRDLGWILFHASVLMVAWSGVFLWFMRIDRAPEALTSVLRAETLVPEVKPWDREQAEPPTQGATSSSASEVPAVRWSPDERVGLQERKRVRFCLVGDIAYIRAAGDYTEVHLSSGEVATVTQRLRYWESQLPESFVRIHRSTLINLELTEELTQVDSAWRVRLRGCPEPLTVSRRLESAVMAKVIGRRARPST